MKVLASEITHRGFPVLADLPALLGGESEGRVLFVSPDDFQGEGIEREKRMARGFISGETSLEDYEGFLRENASVSPQLLREFLDEKYPEISGYMDDGIVSSIAHTLVRGEANNFSFDLGADNYRDNFSIMVLDYSDLSVVERAALMTDLSPSDFVDEAGVPTLVGSDEDWRNATIFHEMGHALDRGYDKSDFGRELHGDMKMYQMLTSGFNAVAAYEEKVGVWPKIAEQDGHMRAIYALKRGDDNMSHETSAAIQMSGEGPIPWGTEDDFQEGLSDVRKQVYTQVAVRAGVSGRDDDGAEVAGKEIAQNDTPALYAAVREVYVSGGIDSSPIGKQYAFEFLRGIQELSPVNVPEGLDAEEVFTPPVFDERGQYIPPKVGVEFSGFN